jgi:hypothetical protein
MTLEAMKSIPFRKNQDLPQLSRAVHLQWQDSRAHYCLVTENGPVKRVPAVPDIVVELNVPAKGVPPSVEIWKLFPLMAGPPPGTRRVPLLVVPTESGHVVPHLNCGQVASSVGCRKPTERLSSRRARVRACNVEATSAERQEGSIIASA